MTATTAATCGIFLEIIIFEPDNGEPRIFLLQLDSDIHIIRDGQCPNCEKLLGSEYLFSETFFVLPRQLLIHLRSIIQSH